DERRRVLEEWGRNPVPVPGGTAGEVFEARAAAVPEATALVAGAEHVSYAELNARANMLARLLVRRGVRAEHIVALALPRSVDLIVALLAVLKAGAAYLPLDTAYPRDRLTFM